MGVLTRGSGAGHNPPSATASATSKDERSAGPRMTWKQGDKYIYALTWRGSQQMRLNAIGAEAQMVGGGVDIEGEASIVAIEQKAGAAVLALALDTLPRHVMNVGGTDILPTDSVRSVIGPRAFLDVDSRGSIVRIRHAASSPAIFRAVVRGLVAHMHINLPEDAATTTWSADEPGPSGRGPTAWTWERPLSFTRTRASYTELTGFEAHELTGAAQTLRATSRVRLDPAGHLASLDGDEDLSVTRGDVRFVASKQSLHLGHLRTEHAEAIALGDGLETEVPGLVPQGASKEEELKQVAGGWTLTSIEEALVQLARGRKAPPGFLVESAAYLSLHPEECAGLATLFADDRLGVVGRERLLDVLAASGTPQAQAAMRDALSETAARKDPARFANYLQHVGGIERPTEETLAFLRGVHAAKESDPHARRGAIVALGTATSRVAKEDRARARRDATAIGDALRTASDPADKRAAIAALGNVAMVEDVPVLVLASRDADPDVRGAAALALRHTGTEEGHRTLLGLLSDPDVSVQRFAIDALTHAKLGPADLRVAADAVLNGRTSRELDSRMVSLCAEHVDAGPPVRAILVHILGRSAADPRLQGRIQTLLERLPA